MSYTDIENLVRTARLCGLHPIVRVNDLQYQLIARAMDMGVNSIMIPRIETAEQVEQAVSWAKYPPVGSRGAGGYLTLFEPDKAKFLQDANDEGILIIQIESQKGIDNVDDILRVPHLDCVFVGPFDLSVDLGIPGQMEHPLLIEAIEHIIAKSREKLIPVGIHMGDMKQLKYWSERGISLLSLASDISALHVKAKENLNAVKG